MPSILVGQSETLSLNSLSEFNEHSPLAGTPSWVSSNLAVATITPAIDGLSAVLLGVGTGNCDITVTCLDCGLDGQDLDATLNFDVITSLPTTGAIVLVPDTDEFVVNKNPSNETPTSGSEFTIRFGGDGDTNNYFDGPVSWNISNPVAILLNFDNNDKIQATAIANAVGEVTVSASAVGAGSVVLTDEKVIKIFKDYASSLTITVS